MQGDRLTTAIVRLGEILVPASEAGPDNAGIETDVGSPQCVPLLDVRFAHPDLLCLNFGGTVNCTVSLTTP